MVGGWWWVPDGSKIESPESNASRTFIKACLGPTPVGYAEAAKPVPLVAITRLLFIAGGRN